MDTALTGLEKLRKLLDSSVLDPHQEKIFSLFVDLLENPHILAVTLRNTVEESARQYLLPIVQQGVEDGSLAESSIRRSFRRPFCCW